MMTSAQVVETSVTTTDNSPSQDYTHPDDQTTLLHVTPRFKPFTEWEYSHYRNKWFGSITVREKLYAGHY